LRQTKNFTNLTATSSVWYYQRRVCFSKNNKIDIISQNNLDVTIGGTSRTYRDQISKVFVRCVAVKSLSWLCRKLIF